jgi:hypothetical protein
VAPLASGRVRAVVDQADRAHGLSNARSKGGWEASHPLNRADKPANC